jgi:hypothetical protein
MSFRQGQTIFLQAAFKNRLGQLTDPDTVVFKSRVGKTGPISTYNYPADVTRVSQGLYQYQLLLDQAGPDWWVGCKSTGVVESVAETNFPVLASVFP